MPDVEELFTWVGDARARSVELVRDLGPEQLAAPLVPTVNPLVWELCHLAYFQEYWVLRRGAGEAPWRPDVDRLFDSVTIEHEARWRLPVPPLAEALDYARSVGERVLALLARGVTDELARVVTFSVLHEDMHAEALAYTRQALALPAPALGLPRVPPPIRRPVHGDVAVPGGTLALGAARGAGFCFDNEQWSHPVEVAPFALAAAAVTEAEFADFVDDGGYEVDALWDTVGAAWRASANASLPLYWRRRRDGALERRAFDRWVPVERDADRAPALVHVAWHEAEAYCRWAGRRLPTEAEWEHAAAQAGGESKRALPWGDEPASFSRACVDFAAVGPVPARSAHGWGDTPLGLRQLVGNVWEWTASTFEPYPGFAPGFYEQYSQSSFGTRKVLRGGSFATRGRNVWNTWRNFFPPSRRDVFAGFRTCAR